MENTNRALQRVEDDLACGHTYVAVQRLSTSVQVYPGNLGLRRRLADVHRQTGNWVEAGRWGNFDEDRDLVATAAFERAFPHPRARLHALRWPGSSADQVPERVRAMLRHLEQSASGAWRTRGVPLRAVTPARGQAVARVGWVLFALANLTALVAGYVALVRWIAP